MMESVDDVGLSCLVEFTLSGNLRWVKIFSGLVKKKGN